MNFTSSCFNKCLNTFSSPLKESPLLCCETGYCPVSTTLFQGEITLTSITSLRCPFIFTFPRSSLPAYCRARNATVEL